MKHSIGQYKDYNGNVTYNKIEIPANLLEDSEYFSKVKVDLDRNIWILSNYESGMGISSKHFYKYSNNKEWTKYEFPFFEGTYSNLYALTDFTIDEKGKVWFSEPYYGVFVFDPTATSVEDDLRDNVFSIFPNPATDYIEINSPSINRRVDGNGDIRIYNVLGEIVMSEVVQNFEPLRIDVSSLPPGLYFVRVVDKVFKFVKL